MKIGLLPRFRSPGVADPDWLAGFAQEAERSGADSIWMVEHVIVPEVYDPKYPYSPNGKMPGSPGVQMPDPLECLAFAAAVTSTITLGTAIVIATLHPAVQLAKRVATLDALSKGRVMLGVGIGWMREEYEAVNAEFGRRGARLDEHIDTMRAIWGHEQVAIDGTFTKMVKARVDPRPPQGARIPIVIGGSSTVAAQRAGRLGDGWYPFVISPDDMRARLSELRAAAVAAGRDPAAIEITAWPGSFALGGSFDVDLVQAFVDVGMDRIVLSAEEADGPEPEAVGRLVDRFRHEVLAKLRPVHGH